MKRAGLLILFLLVPGCTRSPPLATGEPAPELELVNVDGNLTRVSQFRGQALLLELFGVHCGSCRASMRILVPLHEELAPRGDVAFWSIDVGDAIGALGADQEVDVRAWRSEFHANWTFAWDADGHPTTDTYPVPGTPTIYVIDAGGRIAHTQVGFPDREALREALVEAAEATA